VFVKVCGITAVVDALTAIDLGADALGFVFWPESPRFVDPFRARAIVARLPPFVGVVGVFVNQPADYVNGVAALARLTAVQLHGDEDAAYAASMTRPVIKAVSAAAQDDQAWPARVTLLVDAHDREKRGGTGVTSDWSAAARLAQSRRVLLAGGLNADNIRRAVAQVRPFGVDVSSGVESSPGIKDRNRMAAFFEAVQS
jgi:phosphoribosylanthranilate isomerase